MDQLLEDQRPEVEVTISAELRTLWARGANVPGAPTVDLADAPGAASETQEFTGPDPEALKPVPGKATRQLAGPPGSRIMLRRDGDRPLRFQGALVFEVVQRWEGGNADFEHGFSLYASSAGDLYGALRLEPMGEASARPVFWCRALSDGTDFTAWTEDWMRRRLAGFSAGLAPQSRRPNDLPDATRAALDTLTAHSLRSLQPLKERKETCHQ